LYIFGINPKREILCVCEYLSISCIYASRLYYMKHLPVSYHYFTIYKIWVFGGHYFCQFFGRELVHRCSKPVTHSLNLPLLTRSSCSQPLCEADLATPVTHANSNSDADHTKTEFCAANARICGIASVPWR